MKSSKQSTPHGGAETSGGIIYDALILALRPQIQAERIYT